MAVTVAIWLTFVVATLWPPFRSGPLGFAVFVLTMTFNEVPVLLLGVFIVSSGFSGGSVELLPSWAGAIVAVATVAGLIWLQVRARTARTALAEGLGDSGRLPPTPWWLGVLMPFQRRVGTVERLRNVEYGPDPAHQVDIYRGSAAAGRDRPVLIHLHGGGFVSGGKNRESVAMLNQLAAHGWLCLSANYGLRTDGQHPKPLVDTKRLIAWTRENSDSLGVDPSQVFLAGCSAGGHLALSAALTPNLAEFQAGFEAAETGVAGVVVLYGYLGPRTTASTSSPALLVGPDAPPVLIVHGAHDTVVPVSSAQAVAAAVRRTSSSPVVFVELPHAQHSFDLFASVRSRAVAAGAEAFLEGIRRGPADSGPAGRAR